MQPPILDVNPEPLATPGSSMNALGVVEIFADAAHLMELFS